MQLFDVQNTSALADEVIDAAQLVNRLVRRELGGRAPGGLSITQIRALTYLDWHAGASLMDVAEHLGLGAPATSRVVDELVKRGLVAREPGSDDRRRVALRLRREGKRALAGALVAARAPVAEKLASLTVEEQARLSAALLSLRALLQPEAPVAAGGARG